MFIDILYRMSTNNRADFEVLNLSNMKRLKRNIKQKRGLTDQQNAEEAC